MLSPPHHGDISSVAMVPCPHHPDTVCRDLVDFDTHLDDLSMVSGTTSLLVVQPSPEKELNFTMTKVDPSHLQDYLNVELNMEIDSCLRVEKSASLFPGRS